MSHLISARRMALAAHLMVSYLSLTQAGFTLETLGFEEYSHLVVPEYALFKASESDLITLIETLDDNIGRLQIQRLSALEAHKLLKDNLAVMRKRLNARDF